VISLDHGEVKLVGPPEEVCQQYRSFMNNRSLENEKNAEKYEVVNCSACLWNRTIP